MNEATATTRPRFGDGHSRRPGRSAARDAATRCSAIAVESAADAERRRLERDLHDGAQQRLVAIAMQLRLLALRSAPDTQTARALASAQDELAEALRELRDLAQGLHPAVLGDHGLGVALRSLAARAPLPVRLVVRLDRRPPAAVEVAAYYLISEALTNVAKHAAAAAARVDVSRERDHIVIEVADDGVGGADPGAGSGLRGLGDRVRAHGGRLSVTSPPGRGTTVQGHRGPCSSPR